MKNAIGIILISILAFAGLAYADGAGQMADDIYKIDNVVVKFSPPLGWALKQGPVPSIHLNFAPMSENSSAASLGIVACYAPFAAGFDMERLMKATENDVSILSREIIDFNDTKAFSSISEIGGLKTKSIQFLKDGNMFTITFIADNKDYDAMLPAIEESLKTFQVISSEHPQAEAQAQSITQTRTVSPAQTPPLPLVAEPFQEKVQADSVVKILLKSGTMVKGKVLEKNEYRVKLDFHGVPLSVYFSDIDTIDNE
jgi:hypothetical protein